MTARPQLSTILVIFLLFHVPALSQNRPSDRYASLGFKTGSTFPDIVLPEITSGKPMSISDFAGKKLIVLHFASW